MISTCTAFERLGGDVYILNKIWYRAATAVNSSSDFLLRFSNIQVYSPVIYRNSISSHNEPNSKAECEMSHVGIVN
jgi:hypothetical protein